MCFFSVSDEIKIGHDKLKQDLYVGKVISKIHTAVSGLWENVDANVVTYKLRANS
jgi:hypothetical protein